jgi:hypothetical protein
MNEFEYGGSLTNAIIFIIKCLISSILGENEYYMFLFFHDSRRCKKKYVVGQIEDIVWIDIFQNSNRKFYTVRVAWTFYEDMSLIINGRA